jgi:glutamine cyclotransferase
MVLGLIRNSWSRNQSLARRSSVRLLKWTRLKAPTKALVHRLLLTGVPRVVPQVIRTLPHDAEAFTQGLAYRNGMLYESTGGYRSSSLREIDTHNGKVIRQIVIPNEFAEGIAILNDRLYQLSWKSGVSRVFTYPQLEEVDEHRYEGEGWGLAAGDHELIITDGSNIVTFRDERFVIRRRLVVQSHRINVRGLNDIERVGDCLYANVYGTTDVLELCLSTGRVLRVIPCRGLFKAAQPPNAAAVMNGIAYNSEQDSFFATGKHWRYIFEFRLCDQDGLN